MLLHLQVLGQQLQDAQPLPHVRRRQDIRDHHLARLCTGHDESPCPVRQHLCRAHAQGSALSFSLAHVSYAEAAHADCGKGDKYLHKSVRALLDSGPQLLLFVQSAALLACMRQLQGAQSCLTILPCGRPRSHTPCQRAHLKTSVKADAHWGHGGGLPVTRALHAAAGQCKQRR